MPRSAAPTPALRCATHLHPPLCYAPSSAPAGTLKARARVTLAGAIISCVALFALLLVVGIFDEEAGKATRRGGTGERCVWGSHCQPAAAAAAVAAAAAALCCGAAAAAVPAVSRDMPLAPPSAGCKLPSLTITNHCRRAQGGDVRRGVPAH